MNPKVSICVPNLNTRPFLAERFETIFKQSFRDWELLVYDSYSEDGAWEYIQELAGSERRMRIWQGPRQGTPGSWNPCIHEARGEFVYIATSDDAMAPDCLEKLVAALEQHKDCDLAHCPLVVVDEAGAPLAEPRWPQGTTFAQGLGELLHRPHIRRAPYDGLLHLTGYHVYLSITQLLIRRTLFSRVGGFPSQWKAASDFNWEMKAGLVANTIHVPDTWATWRRHAQQATPLAGGNTGEWEPRVEEMIQDAMGACEAYLDSAVLAGLRSHWLNWTKDMRMYYTGLRTRRSALHRRLFQLSQLFGGTETARSEVISRVAGRPKWDETVAGMIRRWLESLGRGPILVPIDSQELDSLAARNERVSNTSTHSPTQQYLSSYLKLETR
jgi:glycosyltransferase involved in cell wall biosynthesis